MLFEFSSILITLFLAIFFVIFVLTLGKILRPDKKFPSKLTTYECGEEPVGQAWARFNFRYYVLALLFVVFDVEIAFVYPCAVTFKKWVQSDLGFAAFFEIFFFMTILMLALFYAWKKGDLEWLKSITSGVKDENRTL